MIENHHQHQISQQEADAEVIRSHLTPQIIEECRQRYFERKKKTTGNELIDANEK